MQRTQSDIEKLLEDPDILNMEELDDCISEVSKVLFDLSINHPARGRMVQMLSRLSSNKRHLAWAQSQPPGNKAIDYKLKLMVEKYVVNA